MTSTLSFGIALAIAAATVYGIARILARREPREDELDGYLAPEIRVLTRTRFGRGRTLVLVEVEGRRLLLGSTRSEWSALADLGSAPTWGEERDPFAPIDAELARAIQAVRFPRARPDRS